MWKTEGHVNPARSSTFREEVLPNQGTDAWMRSAGVTFLWSVVTRFHRVFLPHCFLCEINPFFDFHPPKFLPHCCPLKAHPFCMNWHHLIKGPSKLTTRGRDWDFTPRSFVAKLCHLPTPSFGPAPAMSATRPLREVFDKCHRKLKI